MRNFVEQDWRGFCVFWGLTRFLGAVDFLGAGRVSRGSSRGSEWRRGFWLWVEKRVLRCAKDDN